MAEEIEDILHACTTFQSNLHNHENPIDRRKKIWKHIKDICSKPICIGDFEVG